MDISWATNQIAQLIPVKRDEHQNPVMDIEGNMEYGEPKEIKGRIVNKESLIVNRDGVEVRSLSHIITKTRIQESDKILHDGLERVIEVVHDGLGLYDTKPSFYTGYM